MKRADIERDYKALNGRCYAPGRYEGEPTYVPHLDSEEPDSYTDDGEGREYIPTEEDIAEFPALEGCKLVTLYNDDNGFTYHTRS